MQKIEGTTIRVNRGDEMSLSLSIKQDDGTTYTFAGTDEIVFSLYNKNKMSEEAVLIKEVTATAGTTSVTIPLTSTETKIGDLINKPVEYWYEVELNGRYTVIGYDDKGAKLFILYPEGSQLDANS